MAKENENKQTKEIKITLHLSQLITEKGLPFETGKEYKMNIVYPGFTFSD